MIARPPGSTTGRRGRRLGALAVAGGLALFTCAPGTHRSVSDTARTAAATPHSIALGFLDYAVTSFGDPANTALELARARGAGASVFEFNIGWSGVSPTRPPTLADARNPSWAGYDWSWVDPEVRAIATAGMSIVAVIDGAPGWAEGSGRPSTKVAPAGTWDPSASWLGAFAAALAKRYSGTFTPPRAASPLPAIRDWEPWNEPNLTIFLAPQWKRVGAGYRAVSPGIYRRLLNAFYAGVKAVAPRDVVAAGATAPFGDPAGGERIQPVTFWRDLLCLTAAATPTSTRCKARAHFDAISHHPYPIGPPTYHAINADDVTVPDLAKLTRLIPIAERAGTLVPTGPKPLWITEISWESPPDPHGLSYAKQALYLEGAIDVLYHEGASMFIWFNLRDQPLNPPHYTNLQSGVYSLAATPAQDVAKPSLSAFEFPFTAYRRNGVAQLWGMAPAAGPVRIEEQEGTRWVDVATLHAATTRVFSGSLLVGPRTPLRAVAGTGTSLTWTTF